MDLITYVNDHCDEASGITSATTSILMEPNTAIKG